MSLSTPIGKLFLYSEAQTLTNVSFDQNGVDDTTPDVKKQLTEYFAGSRVNFDLKVRPEGTLFQKQVWEEMQKIPFGETITYAELAKRVGRPEAWRAVANACGKNPIVIVIPCHRVVGSYRKLGGYSGGLDKKQWLLQHEASVLSRISRK